MAVDAAQLGCKIAESLADTDYYPKVGQYSGMWPEAGISTVGDRP
jgi:hypothetical protein